MFENLFSDLMREICSQGNYTEIRVEVVPLDNGRIRIELSTKGFGITLYDSGNKYFTIDWEGEMGRRLANQAIRSLGMQDHFLLPFKGTVGRVSRSSIWYTVYEKKEDKGLF